MHTNTYISPSEIIAGVSVRCNDAGMRWRSEGFYVDLVARALAEISFDTLCDKQQYEFIIPDNSIVDIPFFFFNISNVWAVDQSGQRTKVWFKRNFTVSSGQVFTDQMDNDRLNNLGSLKHGNESDNYFYGLRNGQMLLSPSCKRFSKLIVVMSGILNADKTVPSVPMFVREGVEDWCVVRGLQERISEDIRYYAPLLQIAKASLNGEYNPPYDGSWYKAQERMSRLDQGARNDIHQYMASIVYK